MSPSPILSPGLRVDVAADQDRRAARDRIERREAGNGVEVLFQAEVRSVGRQHNKQFNHVSISAAGTTIDAVPSEERRRRAALRRRKLPAILAGATAKDIR